jgi:Protein of unknown function (DUF3563)
MRTNDTPLYDNSLAGILAKLTHGILRDANERAHEGSNNASAPGDASSRRGSWVTRLDTWLWKQDMNRREAYLARSTDVFDLERRLRRLELGGEQAP